MDGREREVEAALEQLVDDSAVIVGRSMADLVIKGHGLGYRRAIADLEAEARCGEQRVHGPHIWHMPELGPQWCPGVPVGH